MTPLRQIESVDVAGREFTRYQFPYAMRLVIFDWLQEVSMYIDRHTLTFKGNNVGHLDIYWKPRHKRIKQFKRGIK